MKLIVGLGNPGCEYDNTRHNIGFMFLDKLKEHYNIDFSKNKFNGIYAEAQIQNEKVIFLKPQSYMNLSGEIVKKYVDFYKIPIEDILIINDDLDMPVGKVKIKYKGSCGGHNGLRNIELHLKTSEYKRVKIGIANNKKIDTKDYVLGKFDSNEIEELNKVLNNAGEMIDYYLNNSFDKFMSKYN